MCGHGVVGAAIVLHSLYGLDRIAFKTVKGVAIDVKVSAAEFASGKGATVQMTLPADPVDAGLVFPSEVTANFAAALGVEATDIIAVTRNSLMDVFIEVASYVDYSAAAMGIDPVKLLEASSEGTRSQVVTSRSGEEGVDFTKRVFAYGSEGKFRALSVQ